MSKFKFMHTLSESKSIFATEEKAIVSCFVKNVAFLLGHPVFFFIFLSDFIILCSFLFLLLQVSFSH